MTVVHMIGNAHLDPVWLWGWQQGADEVTATFRSAADRCDEYPEFIFTAGEAWRYSVVERLDPELFERIKTLVAADRWNLTGGQWVQPDCNLPTGEALRRQLARGQQYFSDRFGRTCSVGFNPDSFGHPRTLPDLLIEAGLSAYAFHRPSIAQFELPGQLVRWRGPGGSEVLAFRIVPAYVTRAADLAGQVEIALESADDALGHTLCFYGVGNHGGGPTKAQIEWIGEHRTSFDGAELRFSTMDAFFGSVEDARSKLPVLDEELEHVFPGCYSVMHDVKQRQYKTEQLLEQAARVVGSLEPGAVDDRLAAAWDDVLFTAFHDVLAGTCVPSAWPSVEAQQGRARIVGEEVIYDATRRAARSLPAHPHTQVVAYNGENAKWKGLLEVEPFIDFDDWGARWVSIPDGTPLPHQLVDAESDALMTRLLVPVEIAPHSWFTLLIRSDPPGSPPSSTTQVTATNERLSGGAVEIDLAATGIARIANDGIELLGANGLGLHWREDESDTWTMDADSFTGPVAAKLDGLVWSVEEDGPLRARARGVGILGSSPTELTVSLDHAGLIEVEVLVTVVESFKALQLTLELPEEPSRRLDGVPGGASVRALGPTEWPVQGWSRLTLSGRDISLVTGDAYSLSVDTTIWQWTLIRTPRMAWPAIPSSRRAAARHADQGVHRFTFQLHTATELREAALDGIARAQMQPPIAFSRYEGVERPTWGDAPPRKLWTEAEKRNERASSS